VIKQNRHKINLLIVGAGEAGRLISGNIIKDSDSSLKVVGFIDDDSKKIGKKINGVPVLGKVEDLKKVVDDNNVKEILIAIPSGRGASIRNIVENSIELGIVYKILPRKSEVLLQDFDKDYIKYIRRVEPEDLLGGTISKSDQTEVEKYVQGKTILVTGAAGSIGSELSRQLSAYDPKKIIFYDWWENGMFELQNHLVKNYPKLDAEFIIGDIKDRKKINAVFACFKPDSVFHAAAYKHVPLMEINAVEAIKNNIFGTKNVAELSIKHGVKKFVMVSTDKAVNPTNIMGATKRAAEKITHIFGESQQHTVFCAVRFGNVINSNGSAIPIFEQQIEAGGPVTVTHPEMTRYFMTIPEAVHLILQAWVMGENNDLFVLDMGEPIKIYDLARLLIALRGYIPDEEIAIKFIGLRPGEKLYEEILVDDESTSSTRVEKIFKTKNYLDFNKLAFLTNLSLLDELSEEDELSTKEIKSMLKKMVSTYAPREDKYVCEVN